MLILKNFFNNIFLKPKKFGGVAQKQSAESENSQ